MANKGWQTHRLGDACSKIGSGATPRGGKDVYLSSGHIALIRSQNVYNNHFTTDGLAFLTEKHADELSNVIVEPGDILLNITGDSVARCTQVPASVLPARVNQHVAIIRPNSEVLDPGFLRYFLVSPQMQDRMLGLAAAGATRNALTKGMIEGFAVPAPVITIQRRIADILGKLDDKIELNRRMNETLESMARRLFRSCFVDFDPVHAKAAHRREHPKLSNADLSRRALPNMAPEIAELFPSGFEDSTLGRIPNGWRSRPLYDIARFVNGAAFKNSDFCDPSIGKPVIKIAELKSGIDSQTKFSQKDVGRDREIQCGDMLYSWSGSPDTSLATFRWTGRDGLLNQHIFKVITENRPDEIFAYYQLTDLRATLVEIARNKQTTGLGHVTVEDMKRLHVIHPTPEVLNAFAVSTGSIYDQSFNLSVDSLTLERTRDKLLPRLLSGELPVESYTEVCDE